MSFFVISRIEGDEGDANSHSEQKPTPDKPKQNAIEFILCVLVLVRKNRFITTQWNVKSNFISAEKKTKLRK